MEFKHSNGKGGPNLKDRRKAMIEQIHFLKLTYSQKTRHQWKRRNAAMQRFYNLRAQMSVRSRTGLAIFAPRWGRFFEARGGKIRTLTPRIS
jgi:hypothetical protein